MINRLLLMLWSKQWFIATDQISGHTVNCVFHFWLFLRSSLYVMAESGNKKNIHLSKRKIRFQFSLDNWNPELGFY